MIDERYSESAEALGLIGRLARDSHSPWSSWYHAKVREEAIHKIEGLESDLDSALDVLWRHGDASCRQWITKNYPGFAASPERNMRQNPAPEA
jgi:hypothetical protein